MVQDPSKFFPRVQIGTYTNIKEIAVTIKNTDQVVKPVLIVPSAIEVDKGIQQSFDVYLSSEPEVTTNITLSSDSEHVNFVANTLIFNNENYNVPQSVNFMIDEQEVKTSVIFTFSSDEITTKSATVNIKEKEITTEIIKPLEEGFIKNPAYFYTAYYDVDYHIEQLFVSFNEGITYVDVTSIDGSSFTNNACMICLNYLQLSSDPNIKLKASFNEKIGKLSGTPVFEMEGYKIKATLGDYVEYFLPSAVIPVDGGYYTTNPRSMGNSF